MADPKIVASVVGMLVDDAAKDTVAAAGGNLDAVTLRIREEVKGIEAKLSVFLSNVEGHYESELAKAKAAKGFFGKLFGRSK
jgi:hypothetical protein